MRGYKSAALARAMALAMLTACHAGTGDDSATRASRGDCERLRTRLIELRLQSVTVDREQHRAALERALDDAFVDGCVASMSPAKVACGRAARDAAALTACTKK